jgi:Transglycosylase SLT domain
MRERRQLTAHGHQPLIVAVGHRVTGFPCDGSGRGIAGCRLSTVGASGPVRPERARGRQILGLALAAAAFLGVSLGKGASEAQYLAVFVDGRILPVAGARVIGDGRIHLDLKGGGSLEVPLSRLDRVIEDEVEAAPEPIPKPGCRPGFEPQPLAEGTPFSKEILAASRAADLHPRLVAAVVEAESAFNPFALSKVGAGGLMQLMPSVWLPQQVANPYDPRTNLRLGCQHLKALLERFGDLSLALAAYNAGAATVEKSGGVPPYRETRDFVRRVLARFCPSPGGAS